MKERLFYPYFIGVCLFYILIKNFNNNLFELLFCLFNLIVIILIIKDERSHYGKTNIQKQN